MKKRSFAALLRGGLLITILSLALVGPTGAIALFQQIGNDASPASGHAQIVAQGVAHLPSGQAAWRIVEDTAEPLDVAFPETRALGFAVAVNDGILVNDYAYGIQTRLAAGEASFVGPGVAQQRASISGGNAPYLRIAIVPAGESNDAGGDTLIYAGNGFNAPENGRDIDLLRDVLQEGNETLVGAGSAPSLIHIVSGSATIDDGSDTFELEAGESAEVNGEFSVLAEQNNTVVLAAIIGAEVPAMPRFSGTLTLDFRACPETVTRDQLETDAANGSDASFSECTPLDNPYDEGVRINLNLPDGDRLRLNEAEETDEANVLVHAPLAFGDYVLGRVTEFPDDYSDYLVTDGNLGVVQRGNFTISRDFLDPYRVIYLLQEPADAGTVTINYWTCTAESMNSWSPELCNPMEGPVGTEIVINDGTSQTLDAADNLDTGVWQWSELPVAETDDPASSEQGSYLVAFDISQNTDVPDTVVTVDGANWIEGAGAYQFTLIPSQPNATINYYLTNIVDNSQTGSLRVTGIVCPSADSSQIECSDNAEALLPGVTVTVLEAGDVLTESTATVDGQSLVWDDLAFGLTWVLSDVNIVPPAGYEVAYIVQVISGDTGSEVSVVLDEATPTGGFNVYLIPVDEEPVDSDGDGLTDEDEVNIYGTDPQAPDTDGDCFTDVSEVLEFGTDPLDDTDFPAEQSCNVV